MLHFLGALDNSEICVLVFVCQHGFEDFVDLGLRRLLRLQVTQERGYRFFVAFEEDFYACIAPIANVPSQAVLDGGAVNERAETYPLNDSFHVNFNPQR
jgi:hypothetical protein